MTNVKIVCGVLTANSDFKIYSLDAHLQLGVTITKTKHCNEMPNNCFTMYIFHNDVLTYPPIQ